MDVLLRVNFLELDIESVEFEDPVLQVLWKSQRHTIEAAVKGYLNRQKQVDNPEDRFFGCYTDKYQEYTKPTTPKQTPARGVSITPENIPEPEGKGEEKGEEKGELFKGGDPQELNSLLNSSGFMELDTAKRLMHEDERWQKRVIVYLKTQFGHSLTFKQLQVWIDKFFIEKSSDADPLREGLPRYQDWFRNWLQIQLKKQYSNFPEQNNEGAQLPYHRKYVDDNLQ